MYNILISTNSETYNILCVDDIGMAKIIDAYNYGSESIFINGEKYYFEDLNKISIYKYENDTINTPEKLLEIMRRQGVLESYFGPGIDEYIPKNILESLGENITQKFIKHDFGYLQNRSKPKLKTDSFVDSSRIEEIIEIKNRNFDFTKLIALLKELNFAYENECFLTVPLLIRAIIDHIPPIFGKDNFKEVCGNYGTLSFRENITHLEKSSRKIADSFLHVQIRNKETLPNKTQINFHQNLDVLLGEIVRINKH
jgi:hypothetical protein